MGTAAGNARRAIVADDEADHRLWLSVLLRDHGYTLSEAHDGRELIDMLLMVPPGHFDLVVCDQRMPGARGIDCLARASSRATWIIVTASTDASVELLAREFGALGVLRKPFEPRDFGRLVARAANARASGTHRIGAGSD